MSNVSLLFASTSNYFLKTNKYTGKLFKILERANPSSVNKYKFFFGNQDKEIGDFSTCKLITYV